MTVTAREVVWDALEDALNISTEEEVQSEDALAGMRYLNDMMAMWKAQGVDLEYTTVTKLTDVLTVDDGAIEGIKAKLTIFLCGKYKVEPHSSVLLRAKEGWDAILNLTVSLTELTFPNILPMGSGNTYPAGSGAFFSSVEETEE